VRLSIRYDPSGEFAKAIAEAPGAMRRGMIRGLIRASEIVAAAAVRNLTSNRQIVSGALRVAMAGGFHVDPSTLSAKVGPQQNSRAGRDVGYGFFVERGRGPGRAPPRGALREFLRRKLGVAEEDIDRREFALSRRIAAVGTRGRPFLEPALDANRNQVVQAMERELRKAVAEVDEGGGS